METGQTGQIEIQEVYSTLIDRASSAGLASIAEDFAECTIISHLARSPRVDVLREVLTDLDRITETNATPIVNAARRGNVAHSIDCQGLPAIASLALVVQHLSESVALQGVALVGLVNTGGMRTLDIWVRLLARRKLIAILSWNGGPYAVVPAGSLEPFFGTNPLAFGLPLSSGEPIVADFATSEIAFMDLARARRERTPLPKGSGLDSRGVPSVEAAEVFVEPDSGRLLPIGGGVKGSALMLLIEVLSGALVGGVMGRKASSVHRSTEFAGFVISIAPDLFRQTGVFEAELSDLAADIRASRPIDLALGVRLPGDLGSARFIDARRQGTMGCSSASLVMLRKNR